MTLFDMEPDWRDYWWNMPDFSPKEGTGVAKKLIISFPTMDDYREFIANNQLKVQGVGGGESNAWYPQRITAMEGVYYDSDEEVSTKYPVCIMSKGRAGCQTTGKLLDRMGVKYQFFVESDEYDTYCRHLGADKITSMPFNNLGKGSIPARNFIWEWAKDGGVDYHWIMDDNITQFARLNNGARRNIYCSGAFRAIEDFCDRYSNIAMAGPHGKGFVMDGTKAPINWNSRIYSCSLIKTDLPHRWRGRYNEDTDLCLRLLKDGYCTALFNAFLMQKAITAGAKGNAMKGGNTDNVYNTGDHRRAFAESLKEQHPDCVEVVWKFNRWHHKVDYSIFNGNKPTLIQGVTARADTNEYGMEVRKRK